MPKIALIAVITLSLLLSPVMSAEARGAVLEVEHEEELGEAFPEEDAGMGSWIKITEPIDLELVGGLLEDVKEIGDNFIYGYEGRSYVYADTEGYLVAFMDRDTAAADIIDFGHVYFEHGVVQDFIVGEILGMILEELGYEHKIEEIKYSAFHYPEATNFTLVLGRTENEEEHIHIAVPENIDLLSYSYKITVDRRITRQFARRTEKAGGRLKINDSEEVSTADWDEFRRKSVILWDKKERVEYDFDPYGPNTFTLNIFRESNPKIGILILYSE